MNVYVGRCYYCDHQIFSAVEKPVDRTGLEPVTSALSKQRSKPTELTIQEAKCIFFLNSIESNQPFVIRIVSKLPFFPLLL